MDLRDTFGYVYLLIFACIARSIAGRSEGSFFHFVNIGALGSSI